jgi:hypothetical protein
MKRHNAILIGIFISGTAFAQSNDSSIVINEIMQSNIDCLFVEHEFPDSWVELFNTGDEDVDISNWRIGDSDYDSAWILTGDDLIVPANGYFLIYCDKGATGVHTDFRIDSGKAAVALFNAEGTTVDQVSFKKQPAPNIAYGRISDAASDWRYFITATPGAANEGTTIKSNSTILPAPIFSREGFVGVVGDEPFLLTVSIPDNAPADAILCVTTNGLEPTLADAVYVKVDPEEGETEENAEGSEAEDASDTGDVTLEKSSVWEQEITGTTVVRAKLFSDKALPIRSTTQSYIYHPETTSLPIFSIVTDSAYFYSEDEGILMGEYGNNPNWENDWRRPINIEYFKGAEHEQVINQLCETRIQGGVSRQESQKSLAVYSNKRFGTKRFYTQFWRDKPNVTESKSFLLRNGGGTFRAGRIHDQVAQNLIGRYSKNIDWQAYEPSIVYINGQYYGLEDLRERSNEDYVLGNYGLDDDEIDMIESFYDLKTGSDESFNDFVNLYNKEDITVEVLEANMDIDNFLDMFAIETFAINTDFPNNNVVMWKPINGNGKWRWILKDLDFWGLSWRKANIDLDICTHIENLNSQSNWYAKRFKIFQLFYEGIPELKEKYIDRMSVYLGDIFKTSACLDMIDEIVAEIEPEYLRHLQAFYDDVESVDSSRYRSWKGYLSYMRDTWVEQRRENIYNELKARYDLGDTFELQIDLNGAKISFNELNLSYPTFEGKWFANKEIRLAAENEGIWYILTTEADGTENVSSVTGDTLTLVPQEDYTRYEISYNGVLETAVGTVMDDTLDGNVIYYTIQGMRLTKAPTTAGVYIKVCGNKASKIVVK